VPFVELRDGLPLYFEEHGTGPPIVLVPGWTITTRFWERQIGELAAGHRVVTVDLRGAGNSGKTSDGHSLSSYADDLAEVLIRLDLRGAVLVAWAMGVSVSVLYLTSGDADRVRGFVWVDHSPCFFSEPDWPYALFGDFDQRRLDELLDRLRHKRPEVTRELLSSMFAAPEDWMYAELMKTPTEVAAAMLAAVASVDLRPRLADLDLPVLLVNGGRSVVPPSVGQWLAGQLSQARCVLLEEAGHAPFWDDAGGFNSAVRSFVHSLT
jgi:non-heme chloroperoxidase